jgi:hypothetical protein
VRWSSRGQLAQEQSTTIVVSAEPGAVVTSTKPAPSKAKPAKPEPTAVEPNTQQVHAPGEWLIQIGAFDDEAEARQHLSEARLKASTALAASDPFTEACKHVTRCFTERASSASIRRQRRLLAGNSSAVTSNAQLSRNSGCERGPAGREPYATPRICSAALT